jgi:hypothetical protein
LEALEMRRSDMTIATGVPDPIAGDQHGVAKDPAARSGDGPGRRVR